MVTELPYNPILLIQRSGVYFTRNNRLRKVKGTLRMNIAGHLSRYIEIKEAITNLFSNGKMTGEIFTPVRRLDDYAYENNLPYLQQMILDIESYGLKVINYASEYLLLEVCVSERHKSQGLTYKVNSFLGKNGHYAFAFSCRLHLCIRIWLQIFCLKSRRFCK